MLFIRRILKNHTFTASKSRRIRALSKLAMSACCLNTSWCTQGTQNWGWNQVESTPKQRLWQPTPSPRTKVVATNPLQEQRLWQPTPSKNKGCGNQPPPPKQRLWQPTPSPKKRQKRLAKKNPFQIHLMSCNLDSSTSHCSMARLGALDRQLLTCCISPSNFARLRSFFLKRKNWKPVFVKCAKQHVGVQILKFPVAEEGVESWFLQVKHLKSHIKKVHSKFIWPQKNMDFLNKNKELEMPVLQCYTPALSVVPPVRHIRLPLSYCRWADLHLPIPGTWKQTHWGVDSSNTKQKERKTITNNGFKASFISRPGRQTDSIKGLLDFVVFKC